MRAIVQRVREASVTVDGAVVGAIGPGLLALVGAEVGDGDRARDWMAEKLVNLRIFEDDAGKMNRSLLDVGGSILLVSNFTVAGDAQKGRRPSFTNAMAPEEAEASFGSFVESVRALGVPVETGRFRAQMNVALVNDGPVTIVLQSP
ncbi:MAG: D-aminoacyl-tRNA deacylase [Planctomycetota bacterium]